MRSVDAKVRSVRELLNGAKYNIDFYQREYAWQDRQMRELIDDLTGKFLDSYDKNHARHEVANYGSYFLGSIVISNKNSRRYVVDGQQRLTSLTLLLIFLHHRLKGQADATDVLGLIFSQKYGRKSFNIDVPERTEVYQKLLDEETFEAPDKGESVRNIIDRYNDIAGHWPEELQHTALVFFVDWLLENVYLVEIEAYTDEEAYTIFETMNDRGLSLSLAEMLKGYVLANISLETDQRTVNDLWKSHMLAFKELGKDEDIDFFRNWLRAKYADSIRPGKKGSENKDYERIGTEFHRWIRDSKDSLGLAGSDSYVRFVKRDLDFYARQSQAIRNASRTLVKGWESIRFIEDRDFTLQTQVLLAPLLPEDNSEIVQKKVAMAADFLDIWIARRAWNFRTTNYSSIKYTIFILTKEIRGKSLPDLSSYLKQQLDQQSERFASQPRFRLHQQNYRQMRHILARLTYWLEQQCGLPSHFENLISQGYSRPFEIEHIWADKYERFADQFPNSHDFLEDRNLAGGLLLLQRGLNQSLGASPYEEKRNAYLSQSQNLLARSLHPLAYENNPAFKKFIERTGLPFRPYDSFGKKEQAERQELYIRLAEWVWNPSRLDLDGEKPPFAEPINEKFDDNVNESEDKTDRHEARLAYFTKLLMHAKDHDNLHSNVSPSRNGSVGTRKHGQWWNYVVLQDEARAELYIDNTDVKQNKEIFDKIFQKRAEVEADFGGLLHWQKLDDRRASRISASVPGGWADPAQWDSSITEVVACMKRLYSALAKHLPK